MKTTENISNNTHYDNIIDTINSLEKEHHIHIGSIIKEDGRVKLNENKSGIMINMLIIPHDILQKIIDYISFINETESHINSDESRKFSLKGDIA